MRVALISGAFPPAIDGIGDHTWHLAKTMALRHDVHVFTAHAERFHPPPGVSVTGCFDPSAARSIDQLTRWLQHFAPDEVVLQFNPFSFGPRGFNPWLPRMLVRARENLRFRLTVIFHETTATPESLRSSVLWASHLPQFVMLCRSADRICVATLRWVKQIHRFRPGAEILHLPVGSGVDKSSLSHAAAKRALGIDAQTFVLGMFGSKHPSRLMEWSVGTSVAIKKSGRDVVMLYIGEDGAHLSDLLNDRGRLIDCGPLDRGKAGDGLAAMDAMLAPFSDGLSTRRSSAMAGLQHGVPLLSTCSDHTEAVFLNGIKNGIYLSAVNEGAEAYSSIVGAYVSERTTNAAARDEVSAFYDGNFSWEQIVQRLEI